MNSHTISDCSTCTPTIKTCANVPDTTDGSALTQVQVGLMGLRVHYPGDSTDWDADENVGVESMAT